MGIAALNLTEGITHNTKTAIMKLLLLTVFVAVTLAEEAAEEEKPEAPTAVVKPVHPFYGLWGHQLQWPGVRAPGFSGTCWGCRPLGKRSADAEADAEPGYYGYPYYGYGYGFGYGHALPGHSYAHVHRALGKRSAEPGYYHPYGFYGYPYHFGYHALKPLKPLKSGTAVHPGFATSFVETSGAAGK